MSCVQALGLAVFGCKQSICMVAEDLKRGSSGRDPGAAHHGHVGEEGCGQLEWQRMVCGVS